MTDHSERDEAAWAYANGLDNEVWESLSPPEIDFLAFIAGADWAVKNDPRVLKLVKALKKYENVCASSGPNGGDWAARTAITEWRKP